MASGQSWPMNDSGSLDAALMKMKKSWIVVVESPRSIGRVRERKHERESMLRLTLIY